jgi:hypothetical protein
MERRLNVKVIAAWAQVVMVVMIVVYSTWQLFAGNFAQSFATLPFLFVYYVFVVARLKRKQIASRENLEDGPS